MKRSVCIRHAWQAQNRGDRCPGCAVAAPMDSSVLASERAFTMTLALIDGGAFTPEDAQQLRDRLANYRIPDGAA
jgi:hypothetical protein